MRPIAKIGLIAPFEGLYRQSGYAALEAMRQAIDECTPAGFDVLPLALDDSGDPAQAQRAAQKLLADPSVVAIVGPLLLDAIPAVATVIPPTSTTPSAAIPWYVPPLVVPTGAFDIAMQAEWLTAQVNFVATETSATRVLVLGLPAAWQMPTLAVPTLRVDDLDTALATLGESGDALLWLGRPEAGARWMAALRAEGHANSWWFASQAGADVFAVHSEDRSHAHWLLWTDKDYNVWLQSGLQSGLESGNSATQPNHAVRYAVYRATCDALGEVVGRATPTAARWELQSQPVLPPEPDRESP